MQTPATAWRGLVRRLIPAGVRRRVRAKRRRPVPIQWGSLRRGEPVSRVFGLDRGQPIDRYYIEAFLADHAGDIRGRTLEAGDDAYTRQFGGSGVTQADVLHAVEGNPRATIVADLADGPGIPDEAFDCLVLTQTLQFVYDIHAAIRTCHRALRPGGVLLATASGVGQISRYDMDRWGEYWRLTDASAERLFGEAFGPANVHVKSYGNVLAACALLQGLAGEELSPSELDRCDPDYPVVVAVRAVKR